MPRTTLGSLRKRLRIIGTRHPRWREGFQVREGTLWYPNGFRVTAVDASGAEFGFGVSAGSPETAQTMAHELAALLHALHEPELAGLREPREPCAYCGSTEECPKSCERVALWGAKGVSDGT